MIKPINKGSKASYKGFLFGKEEHDKYLEYEQIMPQLIDMINELKDTNKRIDSIRRW